MAQAAKLRPLPSPLCQSETTSSRLELYPGSAFWPGLTSGESRPGYVQATSLGTGHTIWVRERRLQGYFLAGWRTCTSAYNGIQIGATVILGCTSAYKGIQVGSPQIRPNSALSKSRLLCIYPLAYTQTVMSALLDSHRRRRCPLGLSAILAAFLAVNRVQARVSDAEGSAARAC